MLSSKISGSKQGGQDLIGGLDIIVNRNAFGHQLDSFVQDIEIKHIGMFPGIFIRAPVVESVGKNVEILANVNGLVVAVMQSNILATAFHPELTPDTRMHQFFIEMVNFSQDKK